MFADFMEYIDSDNELSNLKGIDEETENEILDEIKKLGFMR